MPCRRRQRSPEVKTLTWFLLKKENSKFRYNIQVPNPPHSSSQICQTRVTANSGFYIGRESRLRVNLSCQKAVAQSVTQSVRQKSPRTGMTPLPLSPLVAQLHRSVARFKARAESKHMRSTNSLCNYIMFIAIACCFSISDPWLNYSSQHLFDMLLMLCYRGDPMAYV